MCTGTAIKCQAKLCERFLRPPLFSNDAWTAFEQTAWTTVSPVDEPLTTKLGQVYSTCSRYPPFDVDERLSSASRLPTRSQGSKTVAVVSCPAPATMTRYFVNVRNHVLTRCTEEWGW